MNKLVVIGFILCFYLYLIVLLYYIYINFDGLAQQIFLVGFSLSIFQKWSQSFMKTECFLDRSWLPRSQFNFSARWIFLFLISFYSGRFQLITHAQITIRSLSEAWPGRTIHNFRVSELHKSRWSTDFAPFKLQKVRSGIGALLQKP